MGGAPWAIKASGFERSHQAPLLEILTISAHVAVGAALLAATLAVTLLCHRGRAPALEAVSA